MIAGTQTPSDPQWLGIYNAIVVNANDPLGQGRVQLQVPQVLGNAISNWATSMQTGAAAPAVGTQVFAQFLGGNPNSPYYSEGLSTSVVENITSSTSNVLNANPYFVGGSLETWEGNGGTIAAVQPNPNTNPPYQYGCEITATVTTGMLIQQTDMFPVTAAQNYQVGAWVYYPLGGNVSVGIVFNDTMSFLGTTIDVTADTWTFIETTVQATPSATEGYPAVGPAQSSIGDLFTAEAITVIGQIDGALIQDDTITSDAVSFSATDIGGLSATINTAGTPPNNPNDGDLWFDGSNGYLLNQWSATNSTWSPFTFGTNAISAGSVTADLLAAGAIVAGTIAAGAIDGMTINAATINGQTISAADIIVTQNDGGFFYYTQGGSNTIVQTFTTSGTWVCPTGVTSIICECWGGGGGGANGIVGAAAGGGEYAAETALAVTPGNTYTFTVGAAGAGGASGTVTHAGTAGATSSFVGDSVTITAHGGGLGASGGTGGAGGTGSSNTAHHNGGPGGAGAGFTTSTNTYPFTGGRHTFDGSGNNITGQNQALQGGDTAHTSNGSCFTFFLFDYAQIASDLQGSVVNWVHLFLINQHTWYGSGMQVHVGWSSRTSFGSSVPFPTGAAFDIYSAHMDEGTSQTLFIDSTGTSFGSAFNGGGATCILLGVNSNDLSDYGFFDFGHEGDVQLTFNFTTGNNSGASGGGSAGFGGDGGTGFPDATKTGPSGGRGGIPGAQTGGAGGGAGGNGTPAAATAGAAGNAPGGGGGGGGLNGTSGTGFAGGAGGKGQVKVTYTIPGTAVLGGSITGQSSADPLGVTTVPEGALFDRVTLYTGSAPSTPTLGPITYSLNGLPKTIDTHGNTYDSVQQLMNANGQTVSTQAPTFITVSGLSTNLFVGPNATVWLIEGMMCYSTSAVAGNPSFRFNGSISIGGTNNLRVVFCNGLQASGSPGFDTSTTTASALPSTTSPLPGFNNNTYYMWFQGSMNLSASQTGTFRLEAATSASADTFTINALGTYMKLTPIAA